MACWAALKGEIVVVVISALSDLSVISALS